MTQQIELSRSALRHNLAVAQALVPGQQQWPCVKANAYGHGLKEVVAAIDDLVDGYCVVSTSEALVLRQLTNHFIFVLNIVDPDQIEACQQRDIVLPLACAEQRRWYTAAATPVRVHLEIDTGMARTGFKWRHPTEMLSFLNDLPDNIKIEGLWSHYAAVGEDLAFSRQQYEQFSRFVKVYREKINPNVIVHLDKSASVLLADYHWPDDWRQACRLGIATYGFDPGWPQKERLQPALSWKTRVIAVRLLAAGEPVGYGLTFTPTQATYIATIPVGYADGLARAFSNNGQVLIRGTRCPIRGRICMNLTMVEVPAAVAEGDEVVIIGQQGDVVITALDLATQIDTTHYEVVTRLSPDIPRQLID